MCSIKINECFPSWTNKVNENWKSPNAFCVAYPGYPKDLKNMFCWWEKLRKHPLHVQMWLWKGLPAFLIWQNRSLEDWSRAQDLEHGKFQLHPHVQLLFQLALLVPKDLWSFRRSWCCIPLLTSSCSQKPTVQLLSHTPNAHSSIAHPSLQAAAAPSWPSCCTLLARHLCVFGIHGPGQLLISHQNKAQRTSWKPGPVEFISSYPGWIALPGTE